MTIPLATWPSVPTGKELTALKQAKAQIPNAPLITLVRAVPGSPGRILAIGTPPPFLCDYALLSNLLESSRTQAALEWALGLREDSRGMTVLKKLQQIFGPDTIEITDTIESHREGN